MEKFKKLELTQEEFDNDPYSGEWTSKDQPWHVGKKTILRKINGKIYRLLEGDHFIIKEKNE